MGPASALLRYAKTFEPADTNPAWFTCGPAKQCFDNATQVVILRLAAGDSSVRYAEGYAMDAELAIPMQHAWLVDADNKVIDPTWRDVADNLYFGIVFETSFVLDLLRIKQSAGILVDAAECAGTTEQKNFSSPASAAWQPIDQFVASKPARNKFRAPAWKGKISH
ncbi:hypothetical protein MZK49_08955 [Ensifer sesbaniae]|uniref:hypothetical protein n=1 Tax=Ensifer sesbaniae TaxID=1214071 RepID=UPI00200140A5|nr:hypothetical protein [Ensifer sesbaniae]